MSKHTLTNSYHNTEILVTDRVYNAITRYGMPSFGHIDMAVNDGLISTSTRNRIFNALCGSNDCTCGLVR